MGKLAGFALLLLAGFGYFFYLSITAEPRVRLLCAQIPPGMALADLQSFAERHSLGPGKAHEDLNYLVETKSFGRHGCKVMVKNGLVQTSEYTYAD